MQKSNLQFFLLNALSIILVLSILSCNNDNSTNPVQSSEKQILSFNFESIKNPVIGSIDQKAKTIVLTVPFGTNITNLIPTITVSDSATVTPSSGVAQNFTNSVNYTVIAQDGSSITYLVTVNLNAIPTEPIELFGSITKDSTLKDLGLPIDYIVTGDLSIDGSALLTIEPGTTIAFSTEINEFEVNYYAGIKAVGTANKPIIFTGPESNQNKGAWVGIVIYSKRNENEFDYVYINNAGRNDFPGLKLSGNLSISNSKISNCLNDGISMEDGWGSLIKFEKNLIENCDGFPIDCYDFEQAMPINLTSNFVNNGKQYIKISHSTSFNRKMTINPNKIPYFANSLSVCDDTLIINDGVEIAFEYESNIYVYVGGVLKINGSIKGVVLTGYHKEPGSWEGIMVYNSYDNSISNCKIEYAGGWSANLECTRSGKLTLKNVALNYSKGYGAYIDDEATIIHSGVTFKNNKLGNVYNSTKNEVTEYWP